MLFLFLFSILGEWGGWVLESMENSILFFNPSLSDKYKIIFCTNKEIFDWYKNIWVEWLVFGEIKTHKGLDNLCHEL